MRKNGGEKCRFDVSTTSLRCLFLLFPRSFFLFFRGLFPLFFRDLFFSAVFFSALFAVVFFFFPRFFPSTRLFLMNAAKFFSRLEKVHRLEKLHRSTVRLLEKPASLPQLQLRAPLITLDSTMVSRDFSGVLNWISTMPIGVISDRQCKFSFINFNSSNIKILKENKNIARLNIMMIAAIILIRIIFPITFAKIYSGMNNFPSIRAFPSEKRKWSFSPTGKNIYKYIHIFRHISLLRLSTCNRVTFYCCIFLQG